MGTNNVISLNLAREVRRIESADPYYQARIIRMDKLELLEEMMTFQEERSRTGQLNLKMMIQGQVLFKALEENAETHELRSLARSYRRHLQYELEAKLKNQQDLQMSR